MLLLILALQQLPAQNFPAIPKPGVVPDLGALLDHACPGATPRNRSALLKEEGRLAQPAITGNPTADQWVALGCARARLDADSAIAHDGPLMVAGNSWSQGSQRAMIEALKQHPTDARAAEVLSLESLDGDEPDNMRDALSAILTVTERGRPTAATLRACAELALRVGDDKAARDCAVRGLAGGSDSTWHLLRLARLSFRAADTVTGMRQFQLAATTAHDSAARREVDWHLQWFLTPEERKEWDTVSAGGYGPWVRDRLISRDVRDGQPFGARIAEHFGRLEYVETNFRLHVAKVMKNSLRTIPAVREDGSAPTDFGRDTALQGVDVDSVLLLKRLKNPAGVPASSWRDYIRWQTDYDDRGVVWMRFGKPDQRVPYVCPGGPTDPLNWPCFLTATVREIWKYNVDGQQLLLDFENEGFDGSAQATRLVTGVLGPYMCDVDPKRCGLSERAIHGQVSREEIQHLRVEDREYISRATTTDDNSVRTDKVIGLVARFHRLWDPVNGSPIALVTYALAAHDLAIQENPPSRTAAVELALRTWNPAADRWTDTTLRHRWAVPDSSIHNAELTGFLAIPSTSGVSSWSLVASQDDQRRGRVWDVTTPGLASGALAISDLVIGAGGDAMTWDLRGESIAIAPDGAVSRTVPMSLYFQVRSAAPRSDLRATVALYQVTSNATDSAAVLQVGFAQVVRAGINEIAPEVDLSHLDRGTYRLEVRLSDPDGRVLVSRSASLQLQ